MKRRLFNLAAAVSLVMMLAIVALWVRGFLGTDYFFVHDGRVIIGSGQGKLGWFYRSSFAADSATWSHELLADYPVDRFFTDYTGVHGSGRLGFSFWARTRSPPDFWFAVVIRHWVLVGFSAVLPSIHVARTLRTRDPPGCCTHCGYDLRATPERCPECGTAVAP
jgi:hypothetical protein